MGSTGRVVGEGFSHRNDGFVANYGSNFRNNFQKQSNSRTLIPELKTFEYFEIKLFMEMQSLSRNEKYKKHSSIP